MKIHLITLPLLASALGACVSTEKVLTYDQEGSEGPLNDGGITFSLSIEPHRNHFDVDPVFMASSAGEPYQIALIALKGQGDMGLLELSKLETTMHDQTVYDVLQGRPVRALPTKRWPERASFRSEGLPLKFKEGAHVSVEVHCRTDGREVVIRRTFIGRKKVDTAPIWEAWANV